VPPAETRLLDALAEVLPGIDRERIVELLPAITRVVEIVSRSGPPDPPRLGERPSHDQ